MTSSSTFSSCWTSLRARSSAMLDRSRSSSIAPLAPGEGGMQTASYYAHFPSLWQPARAWTSSLEFLRGYLMKCIMGLVPVDAGEVFLDIDGQRIDLRGKPPEAIVNLGIALVPEGRRLFPKLTVEENLLLGAYRAEARKTMADNLRFCFAAFPILHQRRRQLAGSMSGG